MGRAGDLAETQRLEGRVVFDQFDPGLQFHVRQAQIFGARSCESNQASCQPLPLCIPGNSKFAQIKTVGSWREEDTGLNWVADPPDLAGFGLFGDAL